MAALFAAFGPAPAGLVYDRIAIADGQWWRLLTAHLVHSDIEHLTWNIGGLLVLGSLLERANWKDCSMALLAGVAAVDIALIEQLPHIGFYCGLSGALNALLIPLLIYLWKTTRSPLVPVIAAASLIKILAELFLGHAVFTHTAWASVSAVHLAGWIAGSLNALPSIWRRTSIPHYPPNGELP